MALVSIAPLTTSISGRMLNTSKLLPIGGKSSVSNKGRNSEKKLGYVNVLNRRILTDLQISGGSIVLTV